MKCGTNIHPTNYEAQDGVKDEKQYIGTLLKDETIENGFGSLKN